MRSRSNTKQCYRTKSGNGKGPGALTFVHKLEVKIWEGITVKFSSTKNGPGTIRNKKKWFRERSLIARTDFTIHSNKSDF